jgi:hypothetical protein
MRKRYMIMGIPNVGADNAVEICQCDTNPGEIVEAAKQKILHGKNKMYNRVYLVDHGEENK